MVFSMTRHAFRFSSRLLMAAAVMCGIGSLASGDDRQAAELLPPSTLFYAEVASPAAILDTILTHPLRTRVEDLEDYRKATSTKEYLGFQGILLYVESRLGMSWRAAVEALTANGVAVGVDPVTEGVAIIFHARDAETLDRLVSEAMQLAREDAKRKSQPDPYESSEYRGFTVQRTKQGLFATVGDRLLIVNKPELGQSIIDRLLDQGTDSLATQPRFQAAQTPQVTGATGWAWVDVAVLRQARARRRQTV
ncbi:MAG: hypothetical protein R3B90_04980 [Planctomycetaceae bacterium]